MTDTTLRHWTMLRHLPRHPRKIDAATMTKLLTQDGFAVHRRSVERDLVKLSRLFPLVCDEQHKPSGWCWAEGAAAFDLPALDVHSALAFRLAEEHLSTLLPEPTRHHLRPHFDRARSVLDQLDHNALAQWPEKVRVIAAGQALQAPALQPGVLEQVEAALLGERQLLVHYRRRGERELRTYDAHPQGLVWRDGVGYLLCMIKDYDQVVQLVLHRMESAEVRDAPARKAQGFTLDQAIGTGSLGFLVSDRPLQLELRFDQDAVVRLREAPLSADQELVDLADGRVQLKATVPDTVQLRTWLHGFGSRVEVLQPLDLRREFSEDARELAQKYLRE